MTESDKVVMQQALDALINSRPHSDSPPEAYKTHGEAIAAIFAAIAQPEQNTELPPLPRASYYEMGHAYSADQMQAYARAALAAQAGQSEPVARVAASFRGRADVLLCNGDNVLPFGTELYTHPAPVRQPLTDKQDRALCEANCNAESDAFFEARPAQDSVENRRMFNAGHRRAWVNYQIVVKPIAQPEQTAKPVAWMTVGYMGEPVIQRHPPQYANQVTPLYYHTAPVRQPLTIQEVEQILAQHNYELHGDRARYIVRMTEAAHGIAQPKAKP